MSGIAEGDCCTMPSIVVHHSPLAKVAVGFLTIYNDNLVTTVGYSDFRKQYPHCTSAVPALSVLAHLHPGLFGCSSKQHRGYSRIVPACGYGARRGPQSRFRCIYCLCNSSLPALHKPSLLVSVIVTRRGHEAYELDRQSCADYIAILATL